jgi:cytoskeletal protein CcmA (bactofilin family)
MKFTKKLLFIQMLSIASVASAASTPLLSSALNSQTVYSGAAITMGASSVIGGNVQATAAATLGANAVVGADAIIDTSVVVVEGAVVSGNVAAGAAVTLGAGVVVSGNVTAGAAVTLGDGAHVGGAVVYLDSAAKEALDNQQVEIKQQLKQAQVALSSMPINTRLATTMTVDTVLQPGVYHAPNLSTTAGITLTLDGNNEPNFWVFNIDTYLSLGANTTIKLLNVTSDSAVIWNTGGYTFVGAGSALVGTVFAGSYVTTGAGATLAGVNEACGGTFTINGAVTLGAGNLMGSSGCVVGAVNNIVIGSDGTASFLVGEIAGADAGPDQSVNEGDFVALVGSESGVLGGSGTYAWEQIGMVGVSLDDNAAPNPVFTAPEVELGGQTLSFELTFTDEGGRVTRDIVNVTVVNVNTSPVAIAGEPQLVTQSSPVILNGSLSYDPDGSNLSYQWTQREGDIEIELFNSDSVHPTFTSESLGEFVFHLAVSDGMLSAEDSVTINIVASNNSPVADAGQDQVVSEDSVVTLDALGSYDVDSDTLTYSWAQVDVTVPVTIFDSVTGAPSFEAPYVGVQGEDFVFEVTVSDGNGGVSNDRVVVHVRQAAGVPNVLNIQPETACLWPPTHNLVSIVISDSSDPSTAIVINSVTQDEPMYGQGNGDSWPDAAWLIGGGIWTPNSVRLRAERDDAGDGRVYQINYTAENAYGTIDGAVYVSAPLGMANGAGACAATDNGQYYQSMSFF